MSKNLDKRLWGVLGKQQTYFSPQKQVEGKKKVPLNSNAFDSWDVKRSRFRRVDGYENAIQQGGVVPQVSSSPSVITPTPTPSITPSPTPSLTPTMTPSITPSSTPYPLPINPSLWFDASDSSTMSFINSGGTDYVSTWTSKGTNGWVLSGANTDRMPIYSASTLMPGNPNCVRFTTNATATLQDGISSFGNTPIQHTGSTWFFVWAKPSGSTYTTSPLVSRVYSGLTNGSLITSGSAGGGIDNHTFNINNGNVISNTYNMYMNLVYGLNLPVYSATNLNNKFIASYNNPGSTGGFSYIEINQSAQTNTTSFTGSTSVGFVNNMSVGFTTNSGGTATYNNSNSELCEVMWFNTELTPAEREQVELYLKDKWRYDEWASPVPTPTPTASSTQTPTPSITPSATFTPTPSSTPPPFNPSSLSPDIWVDFSDASSMTIRTSGANSFISKIQNKGTDTTLTAYTQTNASDQPQVKVSTVFTGLTISAASISNDWLQSDGNFSGFSNTIVYVIGRKAGDGTPQLQPSRFTWGANSYSPYWMDTASDIVIRNFSGSSLSTTITNPNTTTFTGQTYLQYQSASATTGVGYYEINGSGITTTTSLHIGTIPSSTSWLLNESGTIGPKNGEMGEFYLFRRELTSTEKNNLNDYLKTKWGLTF